MAINPERLNEVMARVHPRGVTAASADTRGVAVSRASSDLLDASLRAPALA
jgi:hypothetical protein